MRVDLAKGAFTLGFKTKEKSKYRFTLVKSQILDQGILTMVKVQDMKNCIGHNVASLSSQISMVFTQKIFLILIREIHFQAWVQC